ncbi:MAG TPA: NAD(P)H-binding protein [Actinomycetota bacterium]|jgi:putative NADH-flavin reductase|nr:NAD(P)H-binding protein [Actinomycetota bacterium]
MVFGATGRTGRLLVGLATERGHEVTAFLREGSDPAPVGEVRAVYGDPCDPAAIAAALAEARPEAVISAIGPIAGVTETEVSEAIGAIVAVMTDAGPPRLVIASNVVVFSDGELTGEFADVGAEHRRNLAILRDCVLDWTALAPALLRDDGATGSFVAKVEAPPPGPTIARADLALALLDALERPDWIGRAIGISS